MDDSPWGGGGCEHVIVFECMFLFCFDFCLASQ